MSLRIAIKRSLDDRSTPPPDAPSDSASATTTTTAGPDDVLVASSSSVVERQQQQQQRRVRGRPRHHQRLYDDDDVGGGGSVVILPRIDKCVRNDDPSRIDEFGFVEVPSLLSNELLNDVLREAIGRVERREAALVAERDGPAKRGPRPGGNRKRGGTTRTGGADDGGLEEISNALQADVSEDLLARLDDEVRSHPIAMRTVRAVFGKEGGGRTTSTGGEETTTEEGDDRPATTSSRYEGFVLETPKVLITPPGSPPQHPHADDHCTSCVVCIVHLVDGQEPTRVAPYGHHRGNNNDGSSSSTTTNTTTIDYPTGITVKCDLCDRETMLPDVDYRRGVHLTDEGWTCANGCDAPSRPYDFEGTMINAFGGLLDADAPLSCDAYCGGNADANRAGDGVLALPTLIHRGPGNASGDSRGNRYVLFFTLRPLYKGMIRGAERRMRRYNPELQIHAGCVLYNQFRRVMRIYAEGGCGLEGTFRSVVGLEASSQICKMKLLKDENAALREENRRLRKETAALSMLGGENGMLREENERLRARVAPSVDRTTTTDDQSSTKEDAWKIGNLAGRGGCL